jgi:ribonuclease HI
LDNAAIAEAFGMLTAMKFALECGFREVVCEGDNETIMRRIQKKKQ